ncbi:hypothetical protein DK847_15615 [Aestuariivirga litoralis]|uniref:Uncharacterized protein n=1 Tax=Aestuariivirga litoralis TaxID=2650924 RepID=A0A2W2AR00_9HYPH|nr:hypothetical protein DK847_15615 [Aestuariivirga litoralis]
MLIIAGLVPATLFGTSQRVPGTSPGMMNRGGVAGLILKVMLIIAGLVPATLFSTGQRVPGTSPGMMNGGLVSPGSSSR